MIHICEILQENRFLLRTGTMEGSIVQPVEEFSRRLTRSLALREGITGGEVRVRCRITRVIFVGGGPICI